MATQEQRTQASVDAVLGAAWELFGTDGFHATPLAQIAGRAGVSKSGLLHHFSSKEEVFRRVFLRAEEVLVERSLAAITPEMTPRQQLERGSRELLEALKDPILRQIALVDGPAVLGWEQWRALEAEYAVGIVVAVLRDAHGRGELAIEPTPVAADILLAALHEAAFSLIDHPEAQNEVEILLDRMIGSLFRTS